MAVAGVPWCGDEGGSAVTPAVSPQKLQHLCNIPDIADISSEQAASREGGPVEKRLLTLPKADKQVLGSWGGLRCPRGLGETWGCGPGWHRMGSSPGCGRLLPWCLSSLAAPG